MAGIVSINVYKDGWTGALQLSIDDEDGGRRLAGPKFNGSSTCILSKALSKDDVYEIRQYLKKVK